MDAEGAHGVEDGQDGDADIGKNSHPKRCDTESGEPTTITLTGDAIAATVDRHLTVPEGADVTIDLVRRAVAVKEEYGIQFYDALIVATASKLGCCEIVSEDLNLGQTYCGMAVVNPFLQAE